MHSYQGKVLSIEKRISRFRVPFLLVTYKLDDGTLIYDCFSQMPNAKWRWDQFQRARKGRRVGLVIKRNRVADTTGFGNMVNGGTFPTKTVWEVRRYVPPETLGDAARSWVAYFIRGYLLPWLEKDM